MKHVIRSQYKYRGADCLNCGAPLDMVDRYCHQCSQLNTTKRLALKDFFLEFFSNVFSYDSRTWRTIKTLLFKPGRVTREYVNGRRMSYANPFRFFLSVSIIFFLLVQGAQFYNTLQDITSDNEQTQIDLGVLKINKDKKSDKEEPFTTEDLKEITDKELEELESGGVLERKIARKLREERDKNLAQIADSTGKTKVTINSIIKDEYSSQEALDSLTSFNRLGKQLEDYGKYYGDHNIADAEVALKKMGHRNTSYNRLLYERAVAMGDVLESPDKILEILIPKLPVFLFLMTPLITLFLWLLYARRDYNYMEHLVFSFHVQGFIFISLIIMLLLEWLSWGYIELYSIFFLLIGPFYLYKAMRNFYKQGRIKTILKFLCINFVYYVALSLGLVLLFFIGIVTY